MKVFLVSLLMSTFCFSATAQEEPNLYLVISHMKVEPGMHKTYRQLEKAWGKIHEAKIEAGNLHEWSLFEVLYPNASASDYNYVVYNVMKGDQMLADYHQKPYFPENWESLLTKEEKALVDRTGEIRQHVKTEVWQIRDGVFDENWKDATIQVRNFFSIADGKRGRDHGLMEQKYWKPIHQARINEDKLEGWGMASLEMPYGHAMPYKVTTVDIYKNMEQYMVNYDLEAYAKKVHSDISMEEMMKATRAVGHLEKAEINQLVSRIQGK